MNDIISTENKDICTSLSRNAYTIATLTLVQGDANELETLLKDKVDINAKAFFKMPVVIDVTHIKNQRLIDFKLYKDICDRHNVHLLGLNGIDDIDTIDFMHTQNIPLVNSNKFIKTQKEKDNTKILTQLLTLKVPVEVKVPFEVKVPVEVPCNSPLVLIKRNIRSGEVISSRGNSIVIFGSVGSGAKIIANHHIIIIGDVKGSNLYAGNPSSNSDPGYLDALIYVSGSFDPGIVAIAGNYQTAEDMENDPLIGPGIGQNESIVVTLDRQSLHYWSAHDFLQHK